MAECRFVNSGSRPAWSLDPWCATHERSAICCLRASEREREHTRQALVYAVNERDMLRAEVEMLRGVGCNEDGDGTCGVCLKCLKEGAYAEMAYLREAEARLERERNEVLAALEYEQSEGRKLAGECGQLGLECHALRESIQIVQADRSRLAKILGRVQSLLEQNGCDCECEHHWEEHDDDCDICLACLVSGAMNHG